MKTQIIKPEPPKEPPFEPVTIQITFENQKEFDVFRSLFYISIVTDAIEGVGEGECSNIVPSIRSCLNETKRNKIPYAIDIYSAIARGLNE